MPIDKFDIYSVTPAELLKLVKKSGGQRAFAKKYGIARTTLQDRLYKLRKEPFTHRPIPQAKKIGYSRGVRRFILTSAQDGTALNEAFLDNLEAYRDWLGEYGSCEILVAGYTYGKSLFEDHAKTAVNWPDRIKPYMRSERIRIADKIDFCAEINILPTASEPLNGLETYTQDRWGVVPHAKVQLISASTDKYLPTKQIMTTGAITKTNYVQKLAGQKATFHHVFGAVLVEIDSQGEFFCRHLIADDTGTFYDLDRKVHNKDVTRGHRLKALTPGDVHVPNYDDVAAKAIFGIGAIPELSICGVLDPENIFLHDISDFETRNHHNIGNFHFRYRMYRQGKDSVADEMKHVGTFLTHVSDNFTDSKIYVVDSNHDQALEKWLQNADARLDSANVLFWFRSNTAILEAIDREDYNFSIIEHVVRGHTKLGPNVTFLREDKDRVIIDGVAHHYHGHRGPNGSKGSPKALSKVSGKITMGHVHTCQIFNGLYAAGTTSKMDMNYNRGPSSWSFSLVGQYESGKRTIITVKNGKWCVEIP